jgi:hypothetical protein
MKIFSILFFNHHDRDERLQIGSKRKGDESDT